MPPDDAVVAPAPEAAPVAASVPADPPAAETPPAKPGRAIESFAEIDWSTIPEDKRDALQAEIDRRFERARKNERYRTRKEVEAFYQGRESVAPAAKTTTPATPAEEAPTREKYDSYEAFLEARAEFVGRRAGAEATAKAEAAATAKAEQERAVAGATAFREKTLAKFPDITERLSEIGDLPMYRGVQSAISESELGPEIFNELVAKPTEFDRLMKMSEPAAIREIGRLEARLEASAKPAAPEAKKPSSAPAPIRPVVAKAVNADDEPSHDKPEEWRKWRDRQVQRRKTGTK